MLRQLLLLAFAFACFSAAAQNRITLNGKVVDAASQLPLEAATVYLSAVADSTMVDYTITDKNGNFSLVTQKPSKPVVLIVSYSGFEECRIEEKDLTSKDFGTIRLNDAPIALGEVVVTSEAPPVRIKNDTLEFNASSFKLRPDANVEALLKQLPGVEIDADGKITVNGKEVNQILVNGKPFFDKDGKIALQNLPSEIISKVQVTDLKTKKEELSGKAASSNDSSINLTIDEDKNKGLFGKFMGGYGTDERYESSLLVNYFKGNRKISVLGSSNNINATGFSMNEIFDSMGGGRNSASMWMGGDGSFSINGMQFGGSGITQSNMLGVNYADEWFADFDANMSYFYTEANSENVNRTRQVNLLPEGNYTTESSSTSKNDRLAHNFNSDFEFKLDSTTTVYFTPKFVASNAVLKRQSNEFSVSEQAILLNDNVSDTRDEADNRVFSSSIYVTKIMNRKGRLINVGFDNENRSDLSTNVDRSITNFYADENQDGIPEVTTDTRNQLRRVDNTTDSYSFEIDYQEPLKDSLNLTLGVSVLNKVTRSDDHNFNFDPAENNYGEYNELLSRETDQMINTIRPWAGFQIRKKKLNVQASLGTAITNFSNEGRYLDQQYAVNKDYMLPHASINGNYKFTKSKALYAYFNYTADFPLAAKILPIPDLNNTLNTFMGNPDLDPEKYQYLYFSFRDYDFATKSGYNFYAGGTIWNSQVVSNTTFDESRKRTTTYENVSGTNYLWFGGNWNKSFKREAHSFKYGFGLGVNFSKNKGFTNGELYQSSMFRLSPRANFTYDYGELLSVNPTYSMSFNEQTYKNYPIDKANSVSHRFNLQLTSYWPKQVVFGNDFGYTYNSNIADGFKKDFYLWNISLGYNFFGEKLLAKVKVYDVLNQNQSTSRTITSTVIRDEENTVLQRYAMFSLTYKIDKFAGKR